VKKFNNSSLTSTPDIENAEDVWEDIFNRLAPPYVINTPSTRNASANGIHKDFTREELDSIMGKI